MSIADFQNPLANMPHMQHMQQTQSHQNQSNPYFVQEKFDQKLNEELTTVQESEEQEEKDGIREEDEDKGAKRRGHPRRRASMQNAEEPSETKPKPSDGIHGRFLDIEA
jgi:flagellar biosynthesis GTPase FlhF